MKNTADTVTGGKPVAVLLQSISGVSAINPLVAFYDIHGRKREVLFFILSRRPHETLYFRCADWFKFSLIEKFTYEVDV
jgi:hypothetical protein